MRENVGKMLTRKTPNTDSFYAVSDICMLSRTIVGDFIIVGDFNTEVTQTSMKVFCDSYEFKNLIKDATCYKNPENPSCIDLILTNNPNSFQNSGVIYLIFIR